MVSKIGVGYNMYSPWGKSQQELYVLHADLTIGKHEKHVHSETFLYWIDVRIQMQ